MKELHLCLISVIFSFDLSNSAKFFLFVSYVDFCAGLKMCNTRNLVSLCNKLRSIHLEWVTAVALQLLH